MSGAHVDIAPSIMASHADAYAEQIERVASFSSRLHIDIADGLFAPNKTVDISEVWWPGGLQADVHIMYRRPIEIIDAVIGLRPQLAIMHAEADGDFVTLAKRLHYHGIQVGVALLPKTPVSYIAGAIDVVDHVLLFGGDLGHYAGQADLSQLSKATEVRRLSRRVEIGWDGGVNDQNIKTIADAGIEVIVSGGYLHKAPSAKQAYDTLVEALAL